MQKNKANFGKKFQKYQED